MTKKEELLYYIDNPTEAPWVSISGRNRMSCLERWYNSWYAVSETFTREAIQKMSDETVEACLTLADVMSEAFY